MICPLVARRRGATSQCFIDRGARVGNRLEESDFWGKTRTSCPSELGLPRFVILLSRRLLC